MQTIPNILDCCVPYITTRAPDAAIMRDQHGFSEPTVLVSPNDLKNETFLNLQHKLYVLTCGPFGMEMPKWLNYDSVWMSGASFGFAKHSSQVSTPIKKGLGVPDDYEGLVPYSVGYATPLPDRQTWLLYSVGTINMVAPGSGPNGLGRLTLVHGTGVLGIDKLITSYVWRAPIIDLFTHFGPLELVTAWTPAHDYPWTATFRVRTDAQARAQMLRFEPPKKLASEQAFDADNHEEMKKLQELLEDGARIEILGVGYEEGLAVKFPIRVTPKGARGRIRRDATPGRPPLSIADSELEAPRSSFAIDRGTAARMPDTLSDEDQE